MTSCGAITHQACGLPLMLRYQSFENLVTERWCGASSKAETFCGLHGHTGVLSICGSVGFVDGIRRSLVCLPADLNLSVGVCE